MSGTPLEAAPIGPRQREGVLTGPAGQQVGFLMPYRKEAEHSRPHRLGDVSADWHVAVVLRWAAGLLLLSFLACHNPRRDNPMDPALTAPVEIISAVTNDSTGAVTLAWTPYKGDQPFGAYRVLRRESTSIAVDTLGLAISDAAQTSYVDSSLRPNTEYVYRIAVVNTHGFTQVSEEQRVSGYSAGAVELLDARVDQNAGTVSLAWRQYRGSRFEAYRVERRGGGDMDYVSRSRKEASSDTTFTEDIDPDVEIAYRIVVEAAGQAWPSNQSERLRLSVSSVELLDASVDRRTRGATLRWTQYAGAKFGAYRIERRRTSEDTYESIARLATANDTVFVDPGIPTDSDLFYRIVVDAAGREWASNRVGPVNFRLAPVRLLSATPTPTTGTVRLVWNSYVGPGFQGYEIRRRRAGGEEDTGQVLGEQAVLADTTFVDKTPRADVDYIYTIAVKLADADPVVSNGLDRRLILPAITLSSVDYRSETASATLKWTRYRGPRFRGYQVFRGVGGPAPLVPQPVAEIADIMKTSFVDTSLNGDTEYVHSVVALTDSGERVSTQSFSGGFHRFLVSWPVEVGTDDYGRLYVEPDDRIALLLASKERVRLLTFDTEGHLLDEQVLFEDLTQQIEPHSVATALDPGGKRFLSVARDTILALVSLDRNGWIIMNEEQSLFVDDLPPRLGEAEGTVLGEICIRVSGITSSFVAFDNVAVSREGSPLFEDDFESGDLDGWSLSAGDVGVDIGQVHTTTSNGFQLIRKDPSWQSSTLEVDVTPGNTVFPSGWIDRGATVSIGGIQFTKLAMSLNATSQEARIVWQFFPPPGSSSGRITKRFAEPCAIVPGFPYRLGLGITDGRVKATLKSPAVRAWTRRSESFWSSTAIVEVSEFPAERTTLFATEGMVPHVVTGQGETPLTSDRELPAPASEIRVWEGQLAGSNGQVTGVCLPGANRVLLGLASYGSTYRQWPFYKGRGQMALGGAVGHAEGELMYPISFDAGPDGRIFVLDAGNTRVQVFGSAGSYLTQWGSRGSTNGEFDFGRGGFPEDFRGSIAVDGRGAIYVLDMGNGRIQKFGP